MMMQSKPHRSAIRALGVLALALIVACGEDSRKAAAVGTGPRDSRDADAVPGDYTPFTGDLDVDSIKFAGANAEAETLLALAGCDCAPALLASVAKRLAPAKGTLPQVLMPPIREQIRTDESLKTLLSLPLGLGGLLAGAFANDEKIAAKVREGLTEKLNKAPGGSRLAASVPFRFDGFPSLRSGGTPQMTIADATPRWLLVLSRGGLWDGAQPAAFGDHGWQMMESMRLLVEWKYLFGLDPRPDGGVYGGLTIDPSADTQALGPFDPRTDDGARIVSGAYAFTVDGDTAIDLALNGREKWSHTESPITLGEQALIWRAAAMAFHRLRPENRVKVTSLFSGSDPIFPDNAHNLPMAFLPGVKALLDGEIVDRDSRVIRGAVGKAPSRASLQDLVRMAGALGAWVEELSELSDSGLDAATKDKVKDAPTDMTLAVQLAVQTILKDHVTVSGEHGLALVEKDDQPSPALIAETLTTLVDLEATLLDSPLLESNILGLYHWYVGDVLTQAETSQWTAADVLWGLSAINRAETLPGADGLSWLPDAKAVLQKAADSLDLVGGG